MIKRFYLLSTTLFLLLTLSGCISKPKTLILNTEQMIIMESSLLTAGITAEKPILTTDLNTTKASLQVDNSAMHPVTIGYQFYWYDKEGLNIDPKTPVLSARIPANDGIILHAQVNTEKVEHVRVHLYLNDNQG